MRDYGLPYRYRSSMLRGGDDPLLDGRAGRARPADAEASSGANRGKLVRRSRVPRTCRRWLGKRFSGPHARAEARLIRACLGRGVAVKALRQAEPRAGSPRVGDLALFHNSRDANKNGKLDDEVSHAAVVVAVSGPRVAFVYLRRERVRLGQLHLKQRTVRRRGGRLQNSYLRIIGRRDPPTARYLAGELLSGFVDPR